MTTDWEAIAVANIERNLFIEGAEDMDEEELASETYYEAYTLAFDAVHDAGLADVEARAVAQKVAHRFAQP